MIEDDELRALFSAEATEYLERLEAGLLRLEEQTDDAPTLKQVRRDAHSLKGSARMLGLVPLERLAHRFEDMLESAVDARSLPASSANALLAALDALRALVREAVTGEGAALDLDAVLSDLTSRARAPAAPPSPVPPPQAQAPPAPTPSAEPAGAPVAARAAETPATTTADTVRIQADRLDALLRHSGEIRIAARRSEQRVREIADASRAAAKLTTHLRGGQDAARDLAAGLEHALQRLAKDSDTDQSQLDMLSEELDMVVRQARLLPASSLFNQFTRVVRDTALGLGKEARLVLVGAETPVDKRIVDEMKDPLMHLIRNAIDHGLEEPQVREASGKPRQGSVTLRASRTASALILEVQDDGRGIDATRVRDVAVRRGLLSAESASSLSDVDARALIFEPGFSTSAIVTDMSGRGVGLDVVKATLSRLKGSIETAGRPGEGTTFTIRLPLTLTTARVLIVKAAGQHHAISLDDVATLRRCAPTELQTAEGRQVIAHEGRTLAAGVLAELVGAAPATSSPRQAPYAAVILRTTGSEMALLVDDVVDEQEIVIKSTLALLHRVPGLRGAAILANGDVCPVLDAGDLARAQRRRAPLAAPRPAAPRRRISVLYAEDSITTRTQVKRILESAAFEVTTAVDGVDALNKFQLRSFDAIVTDIDMPNLNGLDLVERIRKQPHGKDVPVILVTARASDVDKKRGVEVGANAYITKGGFDQSVLLDTLKRLT